MVPTRKIDSSSGDRQTDWMLIAALVLSTLADPCATRPLGWSCAAQEIRQRPEDERGLIYMILEAQAAKDAKRLTVDTPADRCWAAKVAGFEYAMLSMATLPGSEMHAYYDRVSSTYQARVEGKLDNNAFVTALSALARPATAAPTEAAMKSALDGELGDLIDGAADALIANAKTAATAFKPDCVI